MLTRAIYDPSAWSVDSDRRRLQIFQQVTAKSLSGQVYKDWQWIVMLHPKDRFHDERVATIRRAAPTSKIVHYTGGVAKGRPLAVSAHQGWREAVGSARGDILSTRIDDDDAFASDALGRIRKVADVCTARTAIIIPNGYRVWAGRYSKVRHESNAWLSICTPSGDPLVAFDVRHREVKKHAPVRFVDERPGWLWVRHADTISDFRDAEHPLSVDVKKHFSINWSVLPAPAKTSGPAGETFFG